MSSPPSSDGMFFSSPPRYTGSGPAEEVETLFATARKATILNKNLATAVDDNDAFLEIFARQVQLLKSRSQAFEDAHITVYDKVLLMLTDHGNNLTSPAAITWYCVEFLGINMDSGIGRNTEIIQLVVAAKNAASQATSPLQPRRKLIELIEDEPIYSGCPVEHKHSKDDPNFAHLWSVYTTACAEYMAIADNRDDTTLEKARFLRDTAENGIDYLKGKYPHDPTLAKLQTTLTMATRAVVALNGGKKRKFDNAFGNGKPPRRNRSPIRKAPVRSGRKIVHNQNNAQRRHQDREHQGDRNKHRGRGPSGIPYGYSRPVDSYYPD